MTIGRLVLQLPGEAVAGPLIAELLVEDVGAHPPHVAGHLYETAAQLAQPILGRLHQLGADAAAALFLGDDEHGDPADRAGPVQDGRHGPPPVNLALYSPGVA